MHLVHWEGWQAGCVRMVIAVVNRRHVVCAAVADSCRLVSQAVELHMQSQKASSEAHMFMHGAPCGRSPSPALHCNSTKKGQGPTQCHRCLCKSRCAVLEACVC